MATYHEGGTLAIYKDVRGVITFPADLHDKLYRYYRLTVLQSNGGCLGLVPCSKKSAGALRVRDLANGQKCLEFSGEARMEAVKEGLGSASYGASPSLIMMLDSGVLRVRQPKPGDRRPVRTRKRRDEGDRQPQLRLVGED